MTIVVGGSSSCVNVFFQWMTKLQRSMSAIRNLITLASNAVLSPSDFGMVVLDDAMQGGASGSARGGLPAPTAAVSSGSQRLPVQAQSREQPTRESRAVPESVAVEQNRDVVTVAGVQVTKDFCNYSFACCM